MLAKNSKAGTRVGKAFNKHLVEKEYFCLVSGDLMKMKQLSEGQKGSYKVSGILTKSKTFRSSQRGGTSVKYAPIPKDTTDVNGMGRICHLEWKHILSVPRAQNTHLISVKTGTGAKHQIRGMLSQLLKAPICGDLRYGAKQPLLDKSVALHARSLHLPSLQLGDTDFKNAIFTAPIPKTWSSYFSLTEDIIQNQTM